MNQGFIKIKTAFKEDKSLRKTFAVFVLVVVMFLLGYYIYIIPALVGVYLFYKFGQKKQPTNS